MRMAEASPEKAGVAVRFRPWPPLSNNLHALNIPFWLQKILAAGVCLFQKH